MDVEGTQLYSLMCTQPQFEFRVPADNNLARLAFFEDADKNGPSETDKQGMSDLITLDTTPISGLQIELGSSVVEGFNFSGTAPSNIPPEDDVEEEPPPQGWKRVLFRQTKLLHQKMRTSHQEMRRLLKMDQPQRRRRLVNSDLNWHEGAQTRVY